MPVNSYAPAKATRASLRYLRSAAHCLLGAVLVVSAFSAAAVDTRAQSPAKLDAQRTATNSTAPISGTVSDAADYARKNNVITVLLIEGQDLAAVNKAFEKKYGPGYTYYDAARMMIESKGVKVQMFKGAFKDPTDKPTNIYVQIGKKFYKDDVMGSDVFSLRSFPLNVDQIAQKAKAAGLVRVRSDED